MNCPRCGAKLEVQEIALGYWKIVKYKKVRRCSDPTCLYEEVL